MQTVNMFEAKTSLSKLVERVESGQEEEIIIARHGRPVARLTGLGFRSVEKRIGVAKGMFDVPENIDDDNEEVEKLFSGRDA
ncbi:MAG: type II toxin-antitoxin system Phd/YefM family antitoxin [Deferrisomatales bacterium]